MPKGEQFLIDPVDCVRCNWHYQKAEVKDETHLYETWQETVENLREGPGSDPIGTGADVGADVPGGGAI